MPVTLFAKLTTHANFNLCPRSSVAAESHLARSRSPTSPLTFRRWRKNPSISRLSSNYGVIRLADRYRAIDRRIESRVWEGDTWKALPLAPRNRSRPVQASSRGLLALNVRRTIRFAGTFHGTAAHCFSQWKVGRGLPCWKQLCEVLLHGVCAATVQFRGGLYCREVAPASTSFISPDQFPPKRRRKMLTK